MTLNHAQVAENIVPAELRAQITGLSTESLIIFLLGVGERSNRKLSVEEITLACWELSPDKHSLRGFPQYPDSYVVMKRIFDMKGRKGLLVGTSSSGFRLTPLSKARFEDIINDLGSGNSRKDLRRVKEDRTITSVDQAPYKRLVSTPAYRKFQDGEEEKIVESDFLYFYGISWSSSKAQIEGKIKNVDATVAKFADKDQKLVELHKFLNSKFTSIRESL